MWSRLRSFFSSIAFMHPPKWTPQTLASLRAILFVLGRLFMDRQIPIRSYSFVGRCLAYGEFLGRSMGRSLRVKCLLLLSARLPSRHAVSDAQLGENVPGAISFVTQLPGGGWLRWSTLVRRHWQVVAHTGFEPVIFALRGRCPWPLDECATRRGVAAKPSVSIAERRPQPPLARVAPCAQRPSLGAGSMARSDANRHCARSDGHSPANTCRKKPSRSPHAASDCSGR